MLLHVSLFRPVVVVDDVDGQWYATVSDGTSSVEVVEWPLLDHPFAADSSTVIRIVLYSANSSSEFLSGARRRFAEAYIPAAKVAEASQRSLVYRWLGLQRGVRYREGEFTAELAGELYENSILLARNLLTPKICCSIIHNDLANSSSADTCRGIPGALWGSIADNSEMLRQLHSQMHTLWTQGMLTATRRPAGDLAARLSTAGGPQSGSSYDSGPGPGPEALAEASRKLQGEVQHLAGMVEVMGTRLQESRQLKLSYRDRLVEVTGQYYPEDDEGRAGDEGGAGTSFMLPDLRPLQQAVQKLEDVWRIEHDRAEGFRWLLEEERGAELLLPGRQRAEAKHQAAAAAPQPPATAEQRELAQGQLELAALREELKAQTSRLVESWAAQREQEAELAELREANAQLRHDFEVQRTELSTWARSRGKEAHVRAARSSKQPQGLPSDVPAGSSHASVPHVPPTGAAGAAGTAAARGRSPGQGRTCSPVMVTASQPSGQKPSRHSRGGAAGSAESHGSRAAGTGSARAPVGVPRPGAWIPGEAPGGAHQGHASGSSAVSLPGHMSGTSASCTPGPARRATLAGLTGAPHSDRESMAANASPGEYKDVVARASDNILRINEELSRLLISKGRAPR